MVTVGHRFQITLKPNVMERLDTMAKERGLTRSALVAIAIGKEWEDWKGGKDSGVGKESEQEEE